MDKEKAALLVLPLLSTKFKKKKIPKHKESLGLGGLQKYKIQKYTQSSVYNKYSHGFTLSMSI